MKKINPAVLKEIKKSGSEYIETAPMRKLTSFRTGGNADILVYPKTEEEFISLSKICRSCGTLLLLSETAAIYWFRITEYGRCCSTSKLTELKTTTS